MEPDRVPELRTARLLLRRWRATDRGPFAALSADPVVMEHFPAMMTRQESDAFVDRIEAELDAVGYGLWVVEVVGLVPAPFVGVVGLHRVPFAAHFSPTTDGTPAVEVGWRLSREHWGRGYATEAARAAIAHGFDTAGLDEIVSFTTLANERSWHVMEARDDARPRRRLRPPERARRPPPSPARAVPARAGPAASELTTSSCSRAWRRSRP